jgi:AraC-like DNA-binding protein
MARFALEPRLPTPLVPALLRFAASRGASAAELRGRFELGDATILDADEIAVTPTTLRALFEAVADVSAEPSLGLRLASGPPVSRKHAPVELAVRSAATVGAALACLARFAPMVHPQVRADCVVTESSTSFVERAPGTRAQQDIGRHADEYVLSFVLSRCREACPAQVILASSVDFSHARPRDIAPLQRFFGTDVIAFGADRSGFTLPRATADARIASHDGRLHSMAIEVALSAHALVPQPSTDAATSLVTSALRELLARGPSLDAVARKLAMSERTVQRRLEEEGTSFLDLLDAVREARARELLLDGTVSLVLVAEQLGFADLATFSRAFKRWTGQPPGTFRRRAIQRGGG